MKRQIFNKNLHCGWGCKLVQAHETVWRFLKKLKTEIPYDSENSILGIYPKKMKMQIQKDMYTSMSTAAKIWKQPKFPSTDKLIKMWHTHTNTYNGIQPLENKIMPSGATEMDLQAIMHAKLH